MNRMRISLIILIALVAIIIILVWKSSYNNSNTSEKDPIDKLINSSLSIQYDKRNTIELSSVFTREFIDMIDNSSNFYKFNLAPYKVVFRNYTLNQVGENEFVVSIHIKDKNGRYIQVIHLIKRNDEYLISEIEYDI